MTSQPERPLTEQQLTEIETRANAATPGPWCTDSWEIYQGTEYEAGAEWIGETCRAGEMDDSRADAEFVAAARTDVPLLLAEVRRLTAALDEMTHCRDNALRALYRDDVDTDIDLEETIAAPFYGPGWDWDESDLQRVVREAAAAVRPAFGKLTQQRDKVRDQVADLEGVLTQIRHLHKDSPMGPCPVCIDADAIAAGGDGLMSYPCPTARLAGATDCEPPHVRAAAAEEQPAVAASEACGKCKQPFVPAVTGFEEQAQYAASPYCRGRVDRCHDTEIADHRCVICA
ncbi:hypothetical protein OG819_42830 [Streptomyces sp. NBC_01549]|uniref:hypothetical protein n=1 Tax=Streptomyces sp. NBC_01549 TaxID=2975874 RepID=UPI00224F2B26|nr:hypothetical protein [Streptomyces sp. NBC_01549]MCX4596153.1 hypothetical protein [Streptomyces sp. NBC_01549]